MQRRIDFLVALFLVLMGVACSSNGASKSNKISTDLTDGVDSLAYIVGMNIANQLQKMDSTINYGVVCRAIMESAEGKAIMTIDEARVQYLRYYLYAEPERKRGYEEQYLADLAANDREYTRTKSGLTYHIEVIGDENLQPRASTDWVVVHYTISRIGGERLYPPLDSDIEYITTEDALEDLLSGIAESVRMIGSGGKIKAWIPSKLAYGENGNEEYGVEPTETLFFEIELVDVQKGAALKMRNERSREEF